MDMGLQQGKLGVFHKPALPLSPSQHGYHTGVFGSVGPPEQTALLLAVQIRAFCCLSS